MKLYARVVDGKIAEYPVHEVHIKNRHHPMDWYTEVFFAEKPPVTEFQYLSEVLTVNQRHHVANQCDSSSQWSVITTVVTEVHCSYVVVDLTLDQVLSRLHRPVDFMRTPSDPETPPLAFADVPPATVARLSTLASVAVQKRLDGFAQARGYDGIVSLASYFGSTVDKFRTEAETALSVRDQTWEALSLYMKNVAEGTLPVPKSTQDIVSTLPVLPW